jgi:uncharacterized protein (TIGR03492 family)
MARRGARRAPSKPDRVGPPRLLVLSNGYGEDLGAAQVIAALPRDRVDVRAYPLVGLGSRYPPTVTLLDPRQEFPSGGFGWIAGWRSFRHDVAQGFVPFWMAQQRTVHAQRRRADLVLAVGDSYCLAVASRVGRPVVYLAWSKSQYVAAHTAVEIWLLRRFAARVFTRDELTAAALRARGIRADFAGFWTMDALRGSGERFGLPAGRPVITVLPGSKPAAFDNLVPLLRAADLAASSSAPRPGVLLAWAPQLSAARLREVIAASGGVWLDAGRFRFQTIEVRVAAGHFADALRCASVVVGMAGAAHEQAAGLGRPVVAFPGAGPQFRRRFLDEQRRLLGEALVPAAGWEDAGRALAALLADPDERERRGRAGRARHGGPGGAEPIARHLLARLGLAPGA